MERITDMEGGRFRARAARAAVIGALIALVAACAPIVTRHGYVPTDEDLQDIVVGVDTRESVASAVGRPSAAGILSDSGWYYVESRFETRGWREPREVDRQVVAISFDDSGVVTNIERFGLERGRVVVLSRRVTDSNVKGIGFLQQLMGNIGRVTADQLVGD
ncbi:Outer membrane protein assembly factor BamE, lipoprotein component of the BamABCDE complex [Meinhardsimonia xiamenensis]|jgi:outer membrane protein assembly factor BamE (lipoprotein component of BamABCDE complex)|uniref:Outer membrane protein assembly factor BamE, lipoprotein component of the BamABCDE complex n=1 Tax=Meinhardsimonia xiamenensis TaxID=990712 RepID=A0A1G9BF79_9RHOB|nr:outer membrane protein assembly factor BamE [Meinhardsimonia xiamenensis]PRX35015.1 Beta-barrel assembly machine subunit BamE [Meinhardsimonia xiamenensis]SDK37724.1 Outer membrane protein assembly factor BamE, lipoprotein component of the BamABCDE complex [Meinhardsimonia xiamenensis]